jgi:carbon-monoxide dehydrogenase small subunit
VATIALDVNGETRQVEAPDYWTLNDVLRTVLELTGTKRACDYGGCGSCTVLLDGEPVYSCVVLAHDAVGHRVETVEGLAAQPACAPLIESFADSYAAQCGWCTPAMVCTASALLERGGVPSDEEIRQAISGVLCRCTGYSKIVEAVRKVAEARAVAAG